ncbi:beta-1,3-galactosyltransferase 6 isoform X2 [Venturia canescens]|uniref:beta-1,3-galactosyltransferase 6 isoform X2 n=1 Tax=Venturia canescens TaxID=32260 RepID=UPI001C9BF53D|nr:beta-1,3-galactosyltransferase 6 isoform X2 [Venturia canescens]
MVERGNKFGYKMLKINRFFQKKFYVRFNVLTIILLLLGLTFIILYVADENRCESAKEIEMDKIKYRLIILILTHPDAMRNRDTIRKTWLSDKHQNVKHLFAIGTFDLQPEQMDTLQSEKHKYNDLLLLAKLEDSYGTLTKKVLISLKEIYATYEFDFLLKCDDDSLVLVHKVLRELDKWEMKGTKKELYWGYFNGKAQVKKRGPWKEHDWNLCDYYLPYAVGGGYVLSSNLIKFIAGSADVLRLYNSEDVSVGLWLAPLANVERKHDVRFDTEYLSRGCSNVYIITHKQSVESMTNLYDHYRSAGVLCARESRNRMSYNYNWTVPPSQCCTRQIGRDLREGKIGESQTFKNRPTIDHKKREHPVYLEQRSKK